MRVLTFSLPCGFEVSPVAETRAEPEMTRHSNSIQNTSLTTIDPSGIIHTEIFLNVYLSCNLMRAHVSETLGWEAGDPSMMTRRSPHARQWYAGKQ